MKNYLLASFIIRNELLSSVSLIQEYYKIIGQRIFVLTDIEEGLNLILTYNIEVDTKISFDQVITNTIRVHRKKETNTLYSLNALNKIVKAQNHGKLDSSFIIDWNAYQNCVLTVRNGETKKIDTKLEQIINL